MRKIIILLVVAAGVLVLAAPAMAFGFGDIKGWFQAETLPLLITGGFFVLALLGAALFWKIIRTLKETGEAMIVLADAAQDKKMSREEWENLKSAVRDVVSIWRKTPQEFLPDAPVEPPPVR